MPTYDYVCQDCGHEFEAFQSITAKPLTECPSCGGEIKRKIGAGAGLIFKGSGFYITDYKNKSGKSATPKSTDSSQAKDKSKPKASKSKDKKKS